MNTTACWRVIWTAALWGGATASAAMAAASATPTLPKNPDVPHDRTAADAQTASESDKPLPEKALQAERSAPNKTGIPNAAPVPVEPGPLGPAGPITGSLAGPAGPGPLAGPGAAVPPIPPPRIGFRYLLIPGYGYKIVEVMPFSAAARMCLDYGDVILTINGCPMTYYGADIPVRARAVAKDGWLTAYIHDVHTGLLVTRSANLFGPAVRPPAPPPGPGTSVPGPVLPPAATSPPVPDAKAPAPAAGETPPPAEPAPKVRAKDAPDSAEKRAPRPESTPSEAKDQPDGQSPPKADEPSTEPGPKPPETPDA